METWTVHITLMAQWEEHISPESEGSSEKKQVPTKRVIQRASMGSQSKSTQGL